jgi:Uma2 family endonuclease
LRREEGILCETFDGVLVEKPRGQAESIIAMTIGIAIGVFIEKAGIDARVSGADSMLRLLGRQVRMPDVAVIFRSFPDGKYLANAVWVACPDLAVEVLSERNTRAEIARKVDEYFTAGTRLVWIVDPATQQVVVHTAPDQSQTFGPPSKSRTLPSCAIAPRRCVPMLAPAFASFGSSI